MLPAKFTPLSGEPPFPRFLSGPFVDDRHFDRYPVHDDAVDLWNLWLSVQLAGAS